MASTSDLRACSKQLLQTLQQLDALLDKVSASAGTAGELDDIAGQSGTILTALAKAQSSLQAMAGGEPTVALEPAQARHAIAVAVAELPLEPAAHALREVSLLAEKAKTRPSSNAVILVPLCLAYRHCLEALLPLAVAVDPRDLR